MLALFYLFFCLLTGRVLLRLFFSPLLAPGFTSLRGEPVRVFRPFLVWPASFCIGYIGLGWVAYGGAYLARGTGRAMAFGAGAAFWAGALVLLAGLLAAPPRPAAERQRPGGCECFALLFAVLAGLFISFFSFWEDAQAVSMAVNVYSDFSPHIAVIRSFSRGSNFPTQYPHFADGTIRYHFMFLFGAGLLEYLGLPLTWAFNLPSLLSFGGLVLLLYTLAHALTASRGAAALSLVFFFFRSSFAFFTFLARRPGEVGLWSWLLENKTFIGTTEHEDWGLFAQNVWANQRHLALGVSLVLLAVLYFLPLFTGGFARLRAPAGPGGAGPAAIKPGLQAKQAKDLAGPGGFWPAFVLCREGWLPHPGWLWGLPMGVLLGAAAFWHGSMVLSALMILAGMGVFSQNRLTYLLTALPVMALSSLQSAFFTGGASPLKIQLRLGFLAASGSWGDIAGYLLLLTGLFFFVLGACLVWAGGTSADGRAPLGRGGVRAFFLCTLLPMVQAFTLTLTVDVAVGHKQVMLSLLLAGIGNAWVLTALWQSRRAAGCAARRLAAALLTALLVVTGAEDAVTYANLCRSGPMRIFKEDALTEWLQQQTPPGSVFITGYITLHPVFTAGRLAYQGWPYFAWSAGYDTTGRDEVLAALFSQSEPSAFGAAARATGAHYLLVDDALTGDERFRAFFEAGGEEIIAAALPLVYQDTYTRVYAIGTA